MNLLPKAFGTRPRLACEIAAGGVVAARSPAPGAPLTAVARVELEEGAIVPGLKPGNVADRVATIAAVRRAMEQVGVRPNARNTDLTLVIPDGAVRVLLLDFDSLPSKLTEALPLVRFRLKRLVPFDTDTAMVSFQIMSSSRSSVRVLAVAIPRDVLNDYETVAREAGFEPGAVLPSTLAALAGLPDSEAGTLAVNVYPSAVTTAIVRSGILLLHRTIELNEAPTVAGDLPLADSATEPRANAQPHAILPLVDREETAEEWAAQEPLPEFGRNPYTDPISAEMAIEDEDRFVKREFNVRSGSGTADVHGSASLYADLPYADLSNEAAPVQRSPYAAASVTDDLQSEIHNSFLTAPPPADSFDEGFADRQSVDQLPDLAGAGAGFSSLRTDDEVPVHGLAPDTRAQEIARAVSVAVAYFEDVLSALPETLLSAGPFGAERLNQTLEEQGLAQSFATESGLRCHELVDPGMLAAEATTAAVPRSLLAGVVGALRS